MKDAEVKPKQETEKRVGPKKNVLIVKPRETPTLYVDESGNNIPPEAYSKAKIAFHKAIREEATEAVALGQLADVSGFENAQMALCQVVRDGLYQLVDRGKNRLVMFESPAKVKAVLRDEVDSILRKMQMALSEQQEYGYQIEDENAAHESETQDV